jgi:hypothetical protein
MLEFNANPKREFKDAAYRQLARIGKAMSSPKGPNGPAPQELRAYVRGWKVRTDPLVSIDLTSRHRAASFHDGGSAFTGDRIRICTPSVHVSVSGNHQKFLLDGQNRWT